MHVKPMNKEQILSDMLASEIRHDLDTIIVNHLKHEIKAKELEALGWIKVTVNSDTNLLDLNEWVYENLQGEWYIHNRDIWFEFKEDATIVGLKWT